MTIEQIYSDMVKQSQDCLLNAIENLKEHNINPFEADINSKDERLNTIKRAAYYYIKLIS